MAGQHGVMILPSRKTDRKTIKAHFQEALDGGFLTGVETNSNYVEFWYWFQFNNLKVTVDGVEYGLHNLGKLSKILESLGKLSKILESGETVRTEWSKMRSEMKLKLDEESQQEFKEDIDKEK
jgi:hypothetical protein